MVQYLKKVQRTTLTFLITLAFNNLWHVTYACNVLMAINHLLHFKIFLSFKFELNKSMGIIRSRETESEVKIHWFKKGLRNVSCSLAQSWRPYEEGQNWEFTDWLRTVPLTNNKKYREKKSFNYFNWVYCDKPRTDVLLSTGKFEDTCVFWKAQGFDRYL